MIPVLLRRRRHIWRPGKVAILIVFGDRTTFPIINTITDLYGNRERKIIRKVFQGFSAEEMDIFLDELKEAGDRAQVQLPKKIRGAEELPRRISGQKQKNEKERWKEVELASKDSDELKKPLTTRSGKQGSTTSIKSSLSSTLPRKTMIPQNRHRRILRLNSQNTPGTEPERRNHKTYAQRI